MCSALLGESIVPNQKCSSNTFSPLLRSPTPVPTPAPTPNPTPAPTPVPTPAPTPQVRVRGLQSTVDTNCRRCSRPIALVSPTAAAVVCASPTIRASVLAHLCLMPPTVNTPLCSFVVHHCPFHAAPKAVCARPTRPTARAWATAASAARASAR